MIEYVAALLQTDTVLKSGRYYPKEVVVEAIKKLDGSKPLFLTSKMPEQETGTIDISKIAASLSDLKIDNDGYVMAKIKPLQTPDGPLAAKDFVESFGIGFGIRGTYKPVVREDGVVMVTDLTIFGVSLVYEPSFETKPFV